MKSRPVIQRLDGQKQFHSVWDIERDGTRAVGVVALRVKHIQVERVKRGLWREIAPSVGENNV